MEKMKTVKKINFWSDGCASQFRSQYAFYMLTKFNRDINIQWNFFEANHGNGAVDGIGGGGGELNIVYLEKYLVSKLSLKAPNILLSMQTKFYLALMLFSWTTKNLILLIMRNAERMQFTSQAP